MGKKTHRRYKEASSKEKEKFKDLLAEEEQLVLATGFGTNYLRHKFALYMMLPGGIFWIGAVVFLYWYLSSHHTFSSDDTWRLSIGFGLLLGMVISMITAYFQVILHYHSHRYFLTTRRAHN